MDCNTALETQITATLHRLRHLSQQDIQAQWHQSQQEGNIADLAQCESWANWAIAPLNQRQHIAWQQGQQVLWLCQTLTIPAALNGYPLEGLTLRLGLTWWAEQADIFVDGERVQQGDLFDCFTRLCLTPAAQPGQQFQVALRLVSPGHDPGALVRSQLFYELPHSPAQACPEPGFVADELAVLQSYLRQFDPPSLALLAEATELINWQAVEQRDRFQQSLAQLRDRLLCFSPWLKQRQIHCIGHAHLDLAWLWPIADTWDAAQRTFASVLNLQTDFPELTYTHSSPALFAWLEQHRPDLFQQIQQQVAEGHWAIDAGLWVEPEFNLISGESIARQILYAQRYCLEKFGHLSRVAWLPDSFGFCWQLPQLFKLGGIRLFATQKLRWNDTSQFPYELFNWQAPDGTSLLSLNLPPIGSDLDPLKMAEHACHWQSQTHLSHSLWLPGMGDHGGGPTRDMLEKFRRWQTSPFFPSLRFSSVEQFLAEICEDTEERGWGEVGRWGCGDVGRRERGTRAQEDKTEVASDSSQKRLWQENTRHSSEPHPPSPSLPIPSTSRPPLYPTSPLPTWNNELYLELHRGCYTTHAEQKWFNRRCEDWLYQAELWSAIASLVANTPYPKADLETAWKQVLFNQFHDILPGTAIAAVYADADQDWQAALQTAQTIAKQSLAAIAHQISPPSPPHPQALPLLVFNPLNWTRSQIVEVPLPPSATHWQILDTQGHPLP
ncbi:MAG: alpha-mannosidase, partial [Almyronema sp.]